MIVIEFGDFEVPLDRRDWLLLNELAGDSEAFGESRTCTTTAVTSVALAAGSTVIIALVLEAARLRGELTAGLVRLCKDLFDYVDLVAAQSRPAPTVID